MSETGKARSPAPLSARLEELGGLLRTSPAAARASALDILKDVPGEPHALMLLVSACRLMGDLAGARDLLQGLSDATPGIAAIQRELGALLSDMGEGEGAVVALSRAAALEPHNPDVWLALGNECSKMHGAEDGAAAYRKYIGVRLRELEKLEAAPRGDRSAAAERNLQEIVAQQPTNVLAIYDLAHLQPSPRSPQRNGVPARAGPCACSRFLEGPADVCLVAVPQCEI
jgi:tetratricopeptide (TPR) repeat protein